MTVEGSVICPHCSKETFVCSDVPGSAWEPGRANWTYVEACMSCDELIKLSGSVESSIEVY